MNKKISYEGNQIHNFISSSGPGTKINYGSGSEFLTSYGSGSLVAVPTVQVPGSTTLDSVLVNSVVDQDRRIGAILADSDPDRHPGPADPDLYPFQPNVKLDYTFMQKVSKYC
jgi:hypothetical protein